MACVPAKHGVIRLAKYSVVYGNWPVVMGRERVITHGLYYFGNILNLYIYSFIVLLTFGTIWRESELGKPGIPWQLWPRLTFGSI